MDGKKEIGEKRVRVYERKREKTNKFLWQLNVCQITHFQAGLWYVCVYACRICARICVLNGTTWKVMYIPFSTDYIMVCFQMPLVLLLQSSHNTFILLTDSLYTCENTWKQRVSEIVVSKYSGICRRENCMHQQKKKYTENFFKKKKKKKEISNNAHRAYTHRYATAYCEVLSGRRGRK